MVCLSALLISSLAHISWSSWGKPFLLAISPCIGTVSQTRLQLAIRSLVAVVTVSAPSSSQREAPGLLWQQRRTLVSLSSNRNSVSLSNSEKKTLSLSVAGKKKLCHSQQQQQALSLSCSGPLATVSLRGSALSSLPGFPELSHVMRMTF